MKEFFPFDLQEDVLYQTPTENEQEIVKGEKGEPGNLRKDKKQKMLKEAEILKIKNWQVMEKGNKFAQRRNNMVHNEIDF